MDLRKIRVFDILDDPTIKKIQKLMVVRVYKKNESFIVEGINRRETDSKGLFVVTAGRMKCYKLSQDGRELIFNVVYPGDFFCDLSIFEKNTPNLSVTAMEKTEMLFLREEDVMLLIRDYPDFSLQIIKKYAERMREYIDKIGDLSFRLVPERLARTLIHIIQKENYEKKGKIILKRNITLYELASMVGSVREVVTRTLQKFEQDGILKMSRHHIEILDYDSFRQAAGI